MIAAITLGRDPDYLARRRANQAYWATQAQRHGGTLSATASTAWVRAGTLRRLRRIVGRDDRVLEIGCGNGNLLGALASQCRAVGVDLTAEMLHVARTHHAAIRGLGQADATWLPFRDRSFDVVYTSRCLINVLDPAKQAHALREILRVVKPSGTVVLSENFEECVGRLNRAKKLFHAGPIDLDAHNLRLKLDETLRLCREFGWVAQRIYDYPLSSFVAHVVIGGLTQRHGGRLTQRACGPLLGLLARLDDAVSQWLPRFGKDTTIMLHRVGS